MSATIAQEEIDDNNKQFWQELCGTQLAKQLGVTDSSLESLAKFDRFYLEYYPYLKKYLHLNELQGANVLEVGLGYGTVGQLLALAGSNYHGLDIASNAVDMTKHRLEQHGFSGDVRVGSMITCPFQDNYFDYVISIGCFHHTGDLQACVDQTYRILKKGGRAIVMVYNKFSLRQWKRWPLQTLKNFLYECIGRFSRGSTDEQRRTYDATVENVGAPETEFFSIKNIQGIFKEFQSVNVTRENFDECFTMSPFKPIVFRFKNREECLDGFWAGDFGLDLYIEVIK